MYEVHKSCTLWIPDNIYHHTPETMCVQTNSNEPNATFHQEKEDPRKRDSMLLSFSND